MAAFDPLATAHAHFRVNLQCMRDELGSDHYDEWLKQACDPYGFEPSKDAQKIPDVMAAVLAKGAEAGHKPETLERIVRSIWQHLKGVTIEQDAGAGAVAGIAGVAG